MYLAILAAFAGWALLWASIAGAIVTAMLLVFFDLKARREEAWLIEAYPDYADYRRHTRKLIPFVY
jgi:protein-S-isoprenylcysteine O-methyltransferase Ste14